MLSLAAKWFYPFWILEHPALNAKLWVFVVLETPQLASSRKTNDEPSEVMMHAGTWRRRKELLTTKWWWIERDTKKETNDVPGNDEERR